MDYKLELVVVPVTDVDRAKAFYSERCGFVVDVDTQISDTFRVVQLTPPGSSCSVTIGPIILDASDQGARPSLQMCVSDIDGARAEYAGRGVDITPIRHMVDGDWSDGRGSGPYESFAFFKDPDGNKWALQEK
jgi:catechol 2,3-dioxygenase-like lactoylglutathione lyase family enzyme